MLAPGEVPPRSGTARAVGCLLVAVVLLVALGVAGFSWLRGRGLADPLPGQQRCVVTANDQSVVLDLEQAHYASIIVGLSVRRDLAPRAASIAMATVYQETGIRNLDYGDRDSVGLFQQRPSQGWGSEKQLMNPHYATGKFYDALVKVKNWRTDDINDVAQKVQRSGYPEAYRDHEADARVLASALTGQSPAALTCLDGTESAGDAPGLVKVMQKTFGGLKDTTAGSLLTIDARTKTLGWAYAQFAVANSSRYGVTAVKIGDQSWRTSDTSLPAWTAAEAPIDGSTVEITLR